MKRSAAIQLSLVLIHFGRCALRVSAAPAIAGDGDGEELEIRLPRLKIITPQRIGQLPQAQQDQWEAYLERSRRLAINERQVMARESAAVGRATSRPAPAGSDFKLGRHHDVAFFNSQAAKELADTIISYQTPSGGWSKAVDYSLGPRQRGTHWTSQSGQGWHYCGTLDNRSTTEQIRFLALIYSTTGDDVYRDAAVRGLRWLLQAQFPSGGWPQVYPLEPGYHEAITLNDDAMVHALEVLNGVSQAMPPLDWVDEQLRGEAAAAVQSGLACLYRAQIVIEAQRTLWCAQHDPLTLAPIAARIKEPPSISGGESAAVVKFLMRRAPDSPEARQSIAAALAWFKANQITGLKRITDAKGKTDYINAPDSSEIYSSEIYWARFYDLQTQKPIFAGADDGVIYSSFSEMAKHNKVAYGYFTTKPAELLRKEKQR